MQDALDTLVSVRGNRVPSGARVGRVTTPDGAVLRHARWMPLARVWRGTVTIAHGRAETIEKYFEVVSELRHRGFAVVTFDWRGQGGSARLLRDPRKGHVRRFADYVTDLHTVVQEVVLPDAPGPHHLLAHSTGGAVALMAARRLRTRFERMVLTAPLLGLYPENGERRMRLARALNGLRLGRAYIPGGGRTAVQSLPFPGNVVTSSELRYRRTANVVEAEPRLALGSPTVGWVHAAFRATEALAHAGVPEKILMPTLIVLAGHERVVSNAAAERFAARMPAGGTVIIPGSRHEILMERDTFRSRFWAAFDWAAFDAFVPGVDLYDEDVGPVAVRR